MFDVTSDPALFVAQLCRDAEARVLRKIASTQLGEAWIDLETEKENVQ
jgi:hypothetical protein